MIGLPGTGKLSLGFAIAGLTGLGFSALNDNSLETLFRDHPDYCIVLLEDIDQAGIRKRESHTLQDNEGNAGDKDDIPGNGVTLSGMLNVLDGVGAKVTLWS